MIFSMFVEDERIMFVLNSVLIILFLLIDLEIKKFLFVSVKLKNVKVNFVEFDDLIKCYVKFFYEKV